MLLHHDKQHIMVSVLVIPQPKQLQDHYQLDDYEPKENVQRNR